MLSDANLNISYINGRLSQFLNEEKYFSQFIDDFINSLIGQPLSIFHGAESERIETTVHH